MKLFGRKKAAKGSDRPVDAPPEVDAGATQDPVATGTDAQPEQAPGAGSEQVPLPGVEAPGVEAAGVEAAGVEAPGVEAPGVEAPGVEAAGVEAPGVDAPAEPVAPESTPETTAEPARTALSAADGAPADSAAQETAPSPEGQKPGWLERLRQGLSRTSGQLASGLGRLFLGRKEIDATLLDDLETELLQADVGVEATLEIVATITDRVARKDLLDGDAVFAALQEELETLLKPCEQPLDMANGSPFVILMVGVNGAGKTTTIGKLARRFQQEGKSVMLAAGDTFRAAAVEQLQTWGDRNKVPVIAQGTGADSASVIFDGLQAARARGMDVLIADTAGRLHNKDNLMEELKKIVRVMGKLDPAAPHEVMLILDAGMGQNALAQAEHFRAAVGVSGITLTKLDGTAKGGIIFAIARKLGLPIRFIGVGEKAEDLRPFTARDFINALFDQRSPP